MENLIKRLIACNDVIVVSNYLIKNKLIKSMGNAKKIINIKYKSFDEVSKDLLGSYSKEAKIDLIKNEKISPELATFLLDNSLLVNELPINKKISSLQRIYTRYHHYLNKNPLITNIYRNRQIIIINDYKTNDLFNKAIKVIEEIADVEYYQLNNYFEKKIKINACLNMKQEVMFLVKNVASLLKEGVAPNHIRINKVPKEYHPYLKEVFELSNLDLDLSENYSLYEYELTKELLKTLKKYPSEIAYLAFPKAIEEVVEKYGKSKLLSKITDVLISYLRFSYLVEDIYEDLIYTLKNTKIAKTEYLNQIQVSNLLLEDISEEDHVFILGFNQDLFPKVFLDGEYIVDDERNQLGLVTSQFKNKQEKLRCLHFIDNIKHLYVTFNMDAVTPISGFVQTLKEKYQVEIVPYNHDIHLSSSRVLDHIELGKKLDSYYKYDLKDEQLYTLLSCYPNHSYRKYSHKFTGIDIDFLDHFLKNDLILSYTSIDKYFKCAYLFYLEKVLKVYRSTNEEALFIGNIFHECLNSLLSEPLIIDFDSFVNERISSLITKDNITLTKKAKFFINKYFEVLKELYYYLKFQSENSDFKIHGLEKEFIVKIDKKYPVTLKGKIDKILTYQVQDKTYAVVLDYKSGNVEFDLNRVVHGLNMQILFYFYFLNQTETKYHFGGGYLQGVLPTSVFSKDSKFSYQDQILNHFRLNGYSTDDLSILGKLDHNFNNDQKFIKGIRITKEGTFYKGSKIITKDEFEQLLKVVENNINNAIDNIFKGNFEINPKRLGTTIDSCRFCPYEDLCYKDINDYQDLKSYENFDFLKGDLS